MKRVVYWIGDIPASIKTESEAIQVAFWLQLYGSLAFGLIDDVEDVTDTVRPSSTELLYIMRKVFLI